MKNYWFSLLFLFLAGAGFSQEVAYNVFGIHTNPLSSWDPIVTLDTLQDAKTLGDINYKYHPSWVATYYSVTISSSCQGVVKKAVSTNDTLSQEQIALLQTADRDCSVEVEVDYLPANNLKYNPRRKMNFGLRVHPIVEAKYQGGDQPMRAYLKEHIVDKISAMSDEEIELVRVRFNVTEEGQVADAQVFNSSEEEAINQLILEALCNMPQWSPAENLAGSKITQAFELSLGTELFRCDYQY